MTDHDRARIFHGFACVMSGARRGNARRWLAKVAGYNPTGSHRWGEDNWPTKARVILDTMAQVHPMQWPMNWRA